MSSTHLFGRVTSSQDHMCSFFNDSKDVNMLSGRPSDSSLSVISNTSRFFSKDML